MWSGVSAENLACHVRMVSSTCSMESAWLASFFSDLRLHSFSTSKLATSRILESDCGKDEEETVRTQLHKLRLRDTGVEYGNTNDNLENVSSSLS